MPPRLPDPASVLSGKVRASIEQLFALIHAANPTDRGLSQRDKSERYALKSRLQSFLIKHHAEALEVVAEGADGVVSLRHRTAGRDAAHAVVASLDDDARRWVETELTLGTPPPLPPPPQASKQRRKEPGDALSRGYAALEAYDFDAARSHFDAALVTHGVDAARALVLLLVEHLCLDDDALATVSRLPATALQDNAVLTQLALAAARSGDPRAEKWARASRSADAWAELAIRAVRAGDLDAATRTTDALRDADGAHPALARTSEAVAAMRQDARRPLEEALTAAFEREDIAEVDRLLPIVPVDSAIVGRIRAHQRRVDGRAAAESAWSAYSRQDFAAVLVHARRARELGDEETRAWIAEAEDAAKEALEAQALGRARTALDSGDLGPYLALDAQTRASVRRERRSPLLDLVERIPDRPGRVDAAQALLRALDAPDTCTDLASHARLLEGLSEYRKLQGEARLRRDRAFLDALGAAEDAWLSGDLDGAAKQVAALDRTHAGSARPRLEELERALASDRSTREAVRRVEALASAGDLLGARDLARAIGRNERAAELAEAIRTLWEIDVIEGADVPLRDVVIPEDDLAPMVGLSDDGASLYLVNGYADRWFVRVVDTQTSAVRTAVSMRLPLPLDGCSSELHGDVLTVFGTSGALLQLSTTIWEVRRWCRPPAGVEGRHVDAATLVAGRYVWYTFGREKDAESIVLDLEAWPTVRQSGLRGRVVPLLGASSPTIVRLMPEDGIVAHAPHGTSLARRLKLNAFPATRVTVVPAADGLLGFVEARALAEIGRGGVPMSSDTATEGVAIVQVRDDGMFRIFGMKDLLRTDSLDVATSLDAGCFLLRRRRGTDARLYGGRIDDWEITGGIDAVVPPSTMFVRDAESRVVRAVSWAEDGIAIFDPTHLVPGWSMDVEVEARLDLNGLSVPFVCTFGMDVPVVEDLADVHLHLAARNWQYAADALDRQQVTAMPPPVAQHWHHLRAIAALWLGDLAGARSSIVAARSREGGCSLDGVVALVDALDRRPSSGPLAAYVVRLLDADAALARGDAKAARDALDCAHTWREFEQQGLLRLAAAWLRLEPETPAERFRKRLALAAVCHGPTMGVPIPPVTWTRERIEEVVEAARQELDGRPISAPRTSRSPS